MNEEPAGTATPARVPVLIARAAGAVEAAVVGLVALAARLAALDHAPYVDELNHVLAARSFLEEGTMRIAGGAIYDRAWLFTRLVAEAFRLFGESLVAARLPAVLAGTALVVVLFLWVRSFAGRLSAWIAAVLFAFSPGAIFVSQLSRFYTLQGLFFLGGALLVLRLFGRSLTMGRTIASLIGAGVLFALALHFQVLTVVGIGAVALWVVLARAPRALRVRGRSRAILLVGGLVVLAAGLLGAPWILHRARGFWELFNRVDVWAAGDRGNVRYYHWLFLEQYATLWTLFPALALLAIRARPREGSFSLLVFAVPFLVQSLAAWKSERYLFYAIPFFFASAGAGLGALIPWLRTAFEEAIRSVGFFARRPSAARGSALALLILAGLFAAAGNGAFSLAAKMVAGSDADWPFARTYRGEPNWGAAAGRLGAERVQGAVLVASSDLKGLYYFGGIDYILSRDLLGDSRGMREEFAPHWKTRVPVVSEAESLRRIVERHPRGLVVVEKKQLRTSWGVPAPAADFLERYFEEIPLPAEWRLRAFRWDRPEEGEGFSSEEPAR
ncbi:MAG: glycosyltransferase family 39 protein [Candidatus Eisenbacteria bacterium]|nr:glycosyltransferase family 39 protein [Candidatus Eisenbacteria bacterium]